MANRMRERMVWRGALACGCAAAVCAGLWFGMVAPGRDAARARTRMREATRSGRDLGGAQALLGRPDRVVRVPGGPRRFLVYRSRPGTVQGPDDVWVLAGPDDRVIAAYYPDRATDRRAVERVLHPDR